MVMMISNLKKNIVLCLVREKLLLEMTGAYNSFHKSHIITIQVIFKDELLKLTATFDAIPLVSSC